MLVCPSEGARAIGYGFNYRFISYGMLDPTNVVGHSITNMSTFAYPAETIVFADSQQYYVRGPGTTTASYWPKPRHNGGSNFGLADGHAKWYTSDFNWYTSYTSVGLKWRPDGVY